jgi:proteasome accessory factor A
VRRVVSEQEVKAALFNPPESTRAFFRGRAVARFKPYIEAIHWDHVVFGQGSPPYRVAFNAASEDARLARLNAAMREASNYADLIRRLQQVDCRGLPQKADWW